MDCNCLTNELMNTYSAILRDELVVAMGCTEPIAIAYAASILSHALGEEAREVHATLSSNIIKNVKSVIVPMTGGLHGIAPAIAAGLVAACPNERLAVLCSLAGKDDAARVASLLSRTSIQIEGMQSKYPFEIIMEATSAHHTARVHLIERHTNLVSATLDGADVTDTYYYPEQRALREEADHSLLTVENILIYADTVDLSPLRPLLRRQVDMNMAIAEEGVRGEWGASIGKTLLLAHAPDGDFEKADVRVRARAYAAAGSDARMSGCELPVSIISGSGNQGMTATIPLVIYAREHGKSEDELLRALIVSDLITIHQKTGIGCLSAYCGAISAGCGVASAICYLLGGDLSAVSHTLVNAVAILSGTICDGAKPSCAAKIAMAVEAGILGYDMTCSGHQFYGGDGIVTKGVENTIRNIGKLARDGMGRTDEEIIHIMLSD